MFQQGDEVVWILGPNDILYVWEEIQRPDGVWTYVVSRLDPSDDVDLKKEFNLAKHGWHLFSEDELELAPRAFEVGDTVKVGKRGKKYYTIAALFDVEVTPSYTEHLATLNPMIGVDYRTVRQDVLVRA